MLSIEKRGGLNGVAGTESVKDNSYGQILKTSSITASARVFSLGIGMLKMKAVAVVLGPSGVGLIALYESTLELISTITGLGISQSGVRQIAEAHGKGDQERLAQYAQVLRRVAIATGLLGVAVTLLFAQLISGWVFKDASRTDSVAMLCIPVLLAAVATASSAFLRGVRRIRELAIAQIIISSGGLVTSVILYGFLGPNGVIPALSITALLNVLIHWWFARKFALPDGEIPLSRIIGFSRVLITLGLAFMVSAALTAGSELTVRAWIVRGFGPEVNGLYQSAWSISGIFAGFILTAMGMDFYPRLTAASSDNATVIRMVNEQIEIGVILALPGLYATVVFSEWIIQLCFSTAFAPAAGLLPWFVLGVYGRVASWPIGFIQLAKGSSKWFVVTQLSFNIGYVVLVWLGLRVGGVESVAVAFAAIYFIYFFGILAVAKVLCGFSLTLEVQGLLLSCGAFIASGCALAALDNGVIRGVVGTLGVLGAITVSTLRITRRLGDDHPVSIVVLKVLRKIMSFRLG